MEDNPRAVNGEQIHVNDVNQPGIYERNGHINDNTEIRGRLEA